MTNAANITASPENFKGAETSWVASPEAITMRRDYIALRFGPKHVIRLRFIHDSDRNQPCEEIAGTIDDLSEKIVAMQALGYGVFFFSNSVKSTVNGFAKDNDIADECRYLFIDADDGLPATYDVEPNLVVHTSKANGVQRGRAEWLIAPPMLISGFKTAQTALAKRYKADPAVSNPSRVLRLPGTMHLKDPNNPQKVTFTAMRQEPASTVGLLAMPLPQPAFTVPAVEAFDWDRRYAKRQPLDADEIREYLNNSRWIDDRSCGVMGFVSYAVKRGYSPNEIVGMLLSNQDTIVMGHFKGRRSIENLVREDVRRNVEKIITDKNIIKPLDELSRSGSPPNERFTKEVAAREQWRLLDYYKAFNTQFAVVKHGNTTVIVDTTDDRLPMMRPEEWFKFMAPHKIRVAETKYLNAARSWFEWEGRRQFSELVLAPGKPKEFADKLNYWRGWAIEPKPGNCQPILNLIDNLCNDRKLADYVLNWFAHLVQRPGEIIGSCLVFRSDQEGVGKGLLARIIGSFFKPGNYAYVSHESDLAGDFNAVTAKALFVFADEAFFGGSGRTADKLKSIVTEPYRKIGYKYVDTIVVPNCMNLMIATNQELAVKIGNWNRRFVFIDSERKYAPHDPWWEQFFVRQETKDGIIEKLPPLEMRQALFDYLLRRDISRFDPKDIPHTAAEAEQRLHSRGGAEGFLADILQDGGVEFQEFGDDGLEIECRALQKAYLAWCKEQKERPLPAQLVSRKLKELLPGCVTTTQPRKGNQDRSRYYYFKPLADCRRAFEKATNSSPEQWDDGEA